MKAVVLSRTAGTKVQIVMDDRFPRASMKLRSDHLLVKVHSVSLSHIDVLHLPKAVKRARCPGRSISGVVLGVGTRCIGGFTVGDEVVGLVRGAFAQYVAGPEEWFAQKPKQLDFISASVLPMSGVAAFQAIRYYADVEPQEEVLVLDGMSSVGNMAIQITKCIKGTKISTTTRFPGSAGTLKSYGAVNVTNVTSRNPNWWFSLRNKAFDVIIDCGMGENSWEKALGVLRKGSGRYISFEPHSPSKLLYRTSVYALRSFEYIQCKVFADSDHLKILGKLVRKGKLKFDLESMDPFEFSEQGGRDIFKHAGSRKSRGHLVCSVYTPEPEEEEEIEHQQTLDKETGDENNTKQNKKIKKAKVEKNKIK